VGKEQIEEQGLLLHLRRSWLLLLVVRHSPDPPYDVLVLTVPAPFVRMPTQTNACIPDRFRRPDIASRLTRQL